MRRQTFGDAASSLCDGPWSLALERLMMRDAKQRLLTWAWSRYVHFKLRSAFRGVWLRGELPDTDAAVLLYANHSNFWDGFVAHAINTRARRDGYVMMEEHTLARYAFLRRLGAFSIRRGSANSARETLRHSLSLLQRPRATVLVFPQGRIENAEAPLRLEGGVELLARRSSVTCVPMAIRYAMFEHECPDVLVSLGEAHAPSTTDDMTARLTNTRDALFAVTRPDEFTSALAGRSSVAERWDAARGLA